MGTSVAQRRGRGPGEAGAQVSRAARAAQAVRVLSYWRDRVPEVMGLLKTAAGDEDPRVRLHAVRAASFFNTVEAADVALTALKLPSDFYLNYTMTETMKQLEPIWRAAVASGKPFAGDNPAGLAFVTKTLSGAELLKMPKSPALLQAILARSDIADAAKTEALNSLAETSKTSRAATLLSVLDALPKDDASSRAAIAKLLPQQPPADLKPLRDRLMQATQSTSADARGGHGGGRDGGQLV